MANAPTSIREQMEQERAARAAWVAANAKKPAAQATPFATPIPVPPAAPTTAAPAATLPVPQPAPAAPAPTEIPMTFFQKFEAEFKKLVGEEPAVAVKIAATLRRRHGGETSRAPKVRPGERAGARGTR